MTPFEHLLLAHLLLDYPLQGEFMALRKKDNLLVLLAHCALWALGVSVALEWIGLYASWKLQWLFFGHLAMDWLKCHHLPRWCGRLDGTGCDLNAAVCEALVLNHEHPRWLRDPLGLPLWIDQAFHLFQIWMCL